MKLNELINAVCDYDQIKVISQYVWEVCVSVDGKDEYADCAQCPNYDTLCYSPEENCMEGMRREKRFGESVRFKGKAEDCPMKLAECKVLKITAKVEKKRPVLQIEVSK